MKQLPAIQANQRGAATILISLLLMFSITLLTLAVAKTQRTELIISANQEWALRLRLASENSNANAHTHLLNETLNWNRTNQQVESAFITTLSHNESIETATSFRRPISQNGPVYVTSRSVRNDGSSQAMSVTQWLLPLSALSPKAEQAPPLVINGCLLALNGKFEITPMKSDQGKIHPSIWTASTNCTPSKWIESVVIAENQFADDLWSDFYVITREEFKQLAAADRHKPESQRRYWYATDSDLTANRWSKNLGNPNQFVQLYIPPDLGCPQFSSGTRIYGLIFIDNSCDYATREFDLDLVGALTINGDFSGTAMSLQLKHIQTLHPKRIAMPFPALRVVTIPGSWKDFE